MLQNYVFVKRIDTGERVLYSPTQVEISDDVAAKMLKENVMELMGEQAEFYILSCGMNSFIQP